MYIWIDPEVFKKTFSLINTHALSITAVCALYFPPLRTKECLLGAITKLHEEKTSLSLLQNYEISVTSCIKEIRLSEGFD